MFFFSLSKLIFEERVKETIYEKYGENYFPFDYKRHIPNY